MKKFLLALLLWSSSVAASDTATSGPVSRGDLLKYRQVFTTADVNLFVDPTGSDSNACTSTGTAACLTIQGALNKAPKVLRHRLTVTMAAGNYAGFVVSGFTIDPSFQKSTAGLLIAGAALTNVTPATGSATGTATGGTAGSTTTFGTLVDAAATWTVNDSAIVGKFITVSSGTGSGQTRTIVSNTATSLTIAGTWTATDATSVYAIQQPATNITSTAAAVPMPAGGNGMVAAGIQVFNNDMGSGTGTSSGMVLLRNIGVSVGTSAGASVTGGFNGYFSQLTWASGSLVLNGMSGKLSFASNGFVTNNQSIIVRGSTLAITNSYLRSTANSAFTASDAANVSISNVALTSAGAGNSAVTVENGAQVVAANLRCDCASAATSSCIAVAAGGSPSKAAPGATFSVSATTGVDVTNCSFGLTAGSSGNIFFTTTDGTLTGNALTSATRVFSGGFITIPSGAPTITSGTSDMSVDGVTGSFSSLATTYECFSGLGTSSRICRL